MENTFTSMLELLWDPDLLIITVRPEADDGDVLRLFNGKIPINPLGSPIKLVTTASKPTPQHIFSQQKHKLGRQVNELDCR